MPLLFKKEKQTKNHVHRSCDNSKVVPKTPLPLNVVILTWVKIVVFRLKVPHFVLVFQILALHVPGSVNL